MIERKKLGLTVKADGESEDDGNSDVMLSVILTRLPNRVGQANQWSTQKQHKSIKLAQN